MLSTHLARDKARLRVIKRGWRDESGGKKKVTFNFFDQNGKMYLLLHGLNIRVKNIQVGEYLPGVP